MLGKLLKNEIKHSARYTMMIYAAVAVIVAIIGISLISSTSWLGTLSCVALYVTGFVAVIVTLVSVIRNFYDTLFGRQGYLTLTLPVKCSTLLISKVIVSFMWIIISFAVMALTYYVIFLYARGQAEGSMGGMMDMLAVSGIFDMLPSGAVIAQVVIIVAVMAILTILTYVGFVYFTVTVVNTRPFQSHPKVFGGIVFFLIFAVTGAVGNLLTQVLPLTLNIAIDKVFFAFEKMGTVEGVMLSYGIGGTVFSGIVAFVLLFVTGYILENKVNLK